MSIFARLSAAAALVTTLVTSGSALALNPQPEPPGYGLFDRAIFDLRADQSVGVRLTNTAARGTAIVTVRYLDANGRVVRTSTANIGPGGRFDDAISVMGVIAPQIVLSPDSTAGAGGSVSLYDAGGRALSTTLVPTLRI